MLENSTSPTPIPESSGGLLFRSCAFPPAAGPSHGGAEAAEETAGARLHAGAPRLAPGGTPRVPAAGAGASQGRRPPLPIPRHRRRVRGARFLRRAHRVRAPQPCGRHWHAGTSSALAHFNRTDGLMRLGVQLWNFSMNWVSWNFGGS